MPGRAFRKARITAAVVAGLGTDETVMDTAEPGFGVRRQSGGPQIYFVRKFARGARHFQSIGEHGTAGLTVTAARARAEKIIAAIKDGATPAERRARERAMPTVAILAEDWVASHVAIKLKRSTMTVYISLIRTQIVPTLGRLRVDQVTEAQVAQMHAAYGAHPYTANRALAVLQKMMGWAERKRFRTRGSNPCIEIERYRELKRARFLSEAELVRLGEAISAEEAAGANTFAIAAIRLLILTGARLNEILTLHWAWVDLSRGMLFLPDSKTGAKTIILSAPASNLLASLPRIEGNPHVLVGAREGTHLTPPNKLWHAVRKAAGLPDVRIHDLRHSFASVALAQGGSLPMISKLLGHRHVSTTARYAHLAADPVRLLCEAAGATIGKALGGQAATQPMIDHLPREVEG